MSETNIEFIRRWSSYENDEDPTWFDELVFDMKNNVYSLYRTYSPKGRQKDRMLMLSVCASDDNCNGISSLLKEMHRMSVPERATTDRLAAEVTRLCTLLGSLERPHGGSA